MMIKDENGNLIRIEVENQGVWKPTIDENGNLKFQFDADTDATNNDEAVKITPFTPTSIYGYELEPVNQTVSFQLISDISPIIRFYNENNEEVY